MKFVYLGKTKNFSLGNAYSFKGLLNNGDVFDLDEKDCVLMKRCMDTARLNCLNEKDMDFKLYASHVAEKEEQAFKKVIEDKVAVTVPVANDVSNAVPQVFGNDTEIDTEEVTVNLQLMKKADLLKICEEKGINVPDGALRPQIIELIKRS